MGDLDKGTAAEGSAFVDDVTFNGYKVDGTVVTLAASDISLAPNGNNVFSGGNRITGRTNPATGSGSTVGPDGNVTVNFREPIVRLELIYKNLQTELTDPGTQAVYISAFTWCEEADIATTLTGPARSQAGQTVSYVVTTRNQGDTNAGGVRTQVQLPTNLQNVTGGTYVASTGVLTLPLIGTLTPNQQSVTTISFTMPASGSVTGTASSTSTSPDTEPANNNGSLANASVTTVQNRPPVANDITAPAVAANAGPTTIPALTGTDPDGNATIASYRVTTLPAQGTLSLNGTPITTSTVLTPAQAAQLQFTPAGSFVGNVTFNYTVTDDLGVSDATPATYTIPVTAVADVVTTLSTTQTAVAPGASITYTARVQNNGPSAAATVASTVQLPAGLLLGAANLPAGASYNNNSGVVTLPTTASLAPGAGSALTYAITFPAPNYSTTITGVAVSSSPTADPSATNNNGSQANAQVSTVVSLPSNGCAGPQYGPARSSGLYGEYFAGYFNDDLNFFAGKTAGVTRYDATVNFPATNSWGNLVPPATGSASDPEAFTARYSGSITIATAGSYTFYLSSDDASYLWLDGAVVAPTTGNAAINNGGLHGTVERSATVTLSAGVHNLLIIYGENGGGNVLTFSYASTTANISKRIVPNSVLCASASQPPVAANVTNSPAMPNTNAATPIAALSATDPDGQIDSYTILTLPTAASGTLFLSTGGNLTAVTAGQVIPAAQAGNLFFDPASDFGNAAGTTNATFTYSATDNSGTGSNVATYTIPVATGVTAFNDVNVTAPNTPITFSVTGNDAGAPRDVATVDLDPNTPGRQTTKTVAGQGTFTVDNAGNVTFTPVAGFLGTAVIPYTVNGTSGVTSNQANIAVTVRALVDLATTVTTTAATVQAGQPVTFTVTASNLTTPNYTSAAGVTQTLQLPAGLTGVSFSNGGSYNNNTGLVTFLTNGTLAQGASTTYGITFTAPTSGPINGTAQISTTSNEIVLTNNVATAPVVITPAFDLATRISGPATVVAGQLVTFNVTSLNLSGSTAPAVAQTVTLPRNLTNVYVSDFGVYDASTGIVTFPTLASLPVGQNANHSVSFIAPAAGAVSVTANIAAGNGVETVTTNNQATAALTVNAAATNNQANLFTTITPSTANPAPAELYQYSVAYGNNGPSAATNPALRILLAPGLTVTGLPAGFTYNTTTGEITATTPLATLASGASQNFTFSVTAPAAGTVTATSAIAATTIDPVPADNVAIANVTVTPRTDLTTAITGTTTAVAGQLVTYNVTAANIGSTAALGTVQTVRIPPFLGPANVTISGGGSYNNNTGDVTFSLGTVEAGATAQNTVSFYMPTETQVSGVSSVSTSTPESNGTNNTATLTTTGQRSADVQIVLATPVSPVVAGTPVVYSVSTKNNGNSPAASETTTVQLPAGLSGVTVSGDGIYNATTGVVTFPTRTNVAPGADGTVTNTIGFLAPDAIRLNVTAVSNVSAATNDLNLSNNVANSAITLSPVTSDLSDLAVSISADAANYAAGSPITYTVTVTNNGSATATDVRTRVALPADLTGFANGTSSGSYSNGANGTGIVLLTANAANVSIASGASQTYTFSIAAPGAGPVLAVASTSSDVSDNVPANNISQTSVNISALADVQTTITGPGSTIAGSRVAYTVITRNNGKSAASSVQQTVQIPAGLTNNGGTVSISGGGTYDNASGLVTFPTIPTLNSGTLQAVINTIAFDFPTAAYTLTANVSTSTAESNTANNTNTNRTNIANQAPVARDVVNNITAPDGSTATMAQAILPLVATDANGTIRSFTLTNLPNTTTQGTMFVDGVAVTEGTVVLLADAGKLSFLPATGFIGNAFFNYTATDNSNLGSLNTATYTLPVGQDNSSVYAYTPTKGGANVYNNNDVLAYVTDINAARYNSAGLVYDATTGALVNDASNGLPTTGTTNAVISAPDKALLNAAGIDINPTTGQFFVSDRTLLRQGSYTVSVTTTDINGGTNTQSVTIPIGSRPLPVTLVSFSAKAAGADARLTWATAQELNNDHFVVERSFDGHAFAAVAEVKGQGTKASATNYTLTDAQAANKAQGRVTYYRLRQVDTDGTSTFSAVQTVTFGLTTRTTSVAVYPNPASNLTNTRLDLSGTEAGTYQVSIVDMTGRVLRSFSQAGASNEALDVTSLPAGTYLVLVKGNGESFTQRLIKE
nr:T9SS type A sorting domain-containing protein [Hymenobacter piscis]